MSSFPPRHICIVGALAVVAGVGSIVGMIAGLIGGAFSFDLGFVGIPIGYGILIGRSSSKNWAIFFAAVGALFLAGFGGWAIFDHFTGGDTLPYPDGVYTAAELAIALVCCVYVLLILCRRASREWFASVCENPAPSKSIAWAIAVVSVVLLLSHHAAEWWVEETHARIFPLRVTVTPYNSQNGEGLSSVSYDSDAILFRRNSKPGLPKVAVSFIGGRDGVRLEFSGVATCPVEVTLKSEGFENTPITLDRSSDDDIRVAMLPIETTHPEQGLGGQPATKPRGGD